MRFGQRLWIVPAVSGPTAHATPRCIELDPGLAFGTGTHPTTALCLEWLDGATAARRFVVDYGCGSGVLAIAALKLGAAGALAVDIDPQALHRHARQRRAKRRRRAIDRRRTPRAHAGATSCWRTSWRSRSWSWRRPSPLARRAAPLVLPASCRARPAG